MCEKVEIKTIVSKILNKKSEYDTEYESENSNSKGDENSREIQLNAINELVNYLPLEPFDRLKLYNQNIMPILISIIDSSDDQIALQNSVTILGDLAIHPKNKNHMFQDTINVMLKFIESNNPITQEKGMIAITNLLADSDHSLQKRFFYSNSLQIISKFLHNITTEETSIIAIEKCIDLILIVINSRAVGKKKALYEANITPELIKLLSHSNKIIQKKITSIFFSLSISLSIRQTLVDEETKNILMNNLKSTFKYQDPSDIQIQANILGIFKNVASVPSNIPLLINDDDDGILLNYITQILELKSEEIKSSSGYSNLIQNLVMLISMLSENSEVKQKMLNIPNVENTIRQFIFDKHLNFETKFQSILALIFLHLPSFVSFYYNFIILFSHYLFIYIYIFLGFLW